MSKRTGIDIGIFPDKKLIVERFNESMSLTDVKNASEAIWGHPNYLRSFNGLVDIRNADVALSFKDILSLLVYFLGHPKKIATGLLIIYANSNQKVAKSYLVSTKLAAVLNMQVVTSAEEFFDTFQIEIPDVEEALEENIIHLEHS